MGTEAVYVIGSTVAYAGSMSEVYSLVDGDG